MKTINYFLFSCLLFFSFSAKSQFRDNYNHKFSLYGGTVILGFSDGGFYQEYSNFPVVGCKYFYNLNQNFSLMLDFQYDVFKNVDYDKKPPVVNSLSIGTKGTVFPTNKIQPYAFVSITAGLAHYYIGEYPYNEFTGGGNLGIGADFNFSKRFGIFIQAKSQFLFFTVKEGGLLIFFPLESGISYRFSVQGNK